VLSIEVLKSNSVTKNNFSCKIFLFAQFRYMFRSYANLLCGDTKEDVTVNERGLWS
jgi:hypothetical protein